MGRTGTRQIKFTVTYRELGALATITVQGMGPAKESRPHSRLLVEQQFDRLMADAIDVVDNDWWHRED